MPEAYRPKGLSSAVCYQDAKAAFRWLEEAFGFEPLFVLLDAEGNLGHSEMTYGNSVVMVGNEWSEDHRSPKSIGGKNSQSIHVQLAEGEDLDAHYQRARAAGAEILMEPKMQFYGDRTYRARDPEGHIWTFSVTVKRMTPAEWDKVSGFTTKQRLDLSDPSGGRISGHGTKPNRWISCYKTGLRIKADSRASRNYFPSEDRVVKVQTTLVADPGFEPACAQSHPSHANERRR